jgi:hypothetical protein
MVKGANTFIFFKFTREDAELSTGEKMAKVVSEIISQLIKSYENNEEVNLTRS